MTTAIYVGKWSDSKPRVIVLGRGEAYCLAERRDLFGGHCQGYDWGEIGNGSTLLAVSLLADVFNETVALDDGELFAAQVIDRLPRREDWEMTAVDVLTWKNSLGKRFADLLYGEEGQGTT
jgi:hypothetical protein